jgi:hypothetical protein
MLCGLGLAFLSFWGESRFRRSESDIIDFTSIVAGGYLVGTPGLYDGNANLELQRRLAGKTDSSRVFPRWRYYGAAIRPLAEIPYSNALRVWRYLMVGALVAFVFLFPSASRWQAALALCWSIPALDGLTHGQDSPLLLVFVALTLAAHRRGHVFVAGLLLSLCAAKYHLFVLVPVLIVAQKRWRFLAGSVCGGAAFAGGRRLRGGGADCAVDRGAGTWVDGGAHSKYSEAGDRYVSGDHAEPARTGGR